MLVKYSFDGGGVLIKYSGVLVVEKRWPGWAHDETRVVSLRLDALKQSIKWFITIGPLPTL